MSPETKPRKMSQRAQSDIVKQVRDAIKDSWEHDRDNRRDAASDLNFMAGDQWPELVRQERQASGRPMLTINRLPQFVRQVTNDIRQADLAIKVTPVDDEADENLTDIYNGLLRQIHYRSNAQHIYSTAAEHQAACGIGWLRVTHDYADDSAFDQELKVEGIRNPLSVYCDPGAVMPDRSDAHWMAITELVPQSEFERRYPKAAKVEMDVPGDEEDNFLFWSTNDEVRIAEYWVKEPVKVTLALLEDGSTVRLDDVDPQLHVVLPIVRTREADSFKVRQYIVSGSEVLEGPYDWIGKHIPIVPVIGAEVPLERRTYRYGIVRHARDAQQLYNYSRTAAAESIALQPKAPYLVTGAMIQKYKGLWDTHNRTNRPYLPYDPDPKAPGMAPKREAPPVVSGALLQEVEIASEDMKATTGIYDASLGAKSNETSGKAILARDHQGDVANYHFIDNLRFSMAQVGRILVDLIPKVYDNERVVRLTGEDGSETPARINTVMYAEDGMPVKVNDLSAGRFDIRVDIGKAYSTKRLESADTMVQLMQALPMVGQIAGDLIVKALDLPGSEELAERIKRTIPPQITQDPEAEPQEPDPMQVAAQEAELAEKQSQVRKNEASASRDEAQALKTVSETERAEVESLMAVEHMLPGGLPPLQ